MCFSIMLNCIYCASHQAVTHLVKWKYHCDLLSTAQTTTPVVQPNDKRMCVSVCMCVHACVSGCVVV